MHHGAHINEHVLIEGRDSARDQALLDNNTVAQDHSVDDALEAPDHAITELLLDTLWLTEVDLLNEEDVFEGRVAHHRSDLVVELVTVPDEQAQFADVAFQQFASHRRTDCTSSAS